MSKPQMSPETRPTGSETYFSAETLVILDHRDVSTETTSLVHTLLSSRNLTVYLSHSNGCCGVRFSIATVYSAKM